MLGEAGQASNSKSKDRRIRGSAVEHIAKPRLVNYCEGLFRYGRTDESLCQRQRDLVDAYVRSAAFSDADSFFFDFLESATDSSRELVIAVGERMLDVARNNTSGESRFEMGRIGDMLNREYAGTADAPDSRRRILDLIDDMLQNGLYEATKIVEQHERR